LQNTHKKICIVTISLAKGGAERSCAMLSEMLYAEGYEVHIAILNNEIDYHYKGTLFNLGNRKKPKENIATRTKRLLKLRKYLKKNKIDLIIDHRTKNDYYRELFYHNVLYKGFKKIYVVHSANTNLYLTKQPKKFAKEYSLNVATVGVSDYISKEILPQYRIHNAVTIHNAFDPSWATSEAIVAPELKPHNYILSYGRIDDTVKDFTFLINAFTASNLWKDGVQLAILGNGPDKEMLQQFVASLPSHNQIVFLPQQNPFPIVSKAQFVTLTSRFEGFPMVLVEALSLSVPVVSLDIVSGPSEIIEHRKNGLLVAKRNVSLFAEALLEMHNNDILREFCKANSKASVSQFSISEISKKWNQILQHAVR